MTDIKKKLRSLDREWKAGLRMVRRDKRKWLDSQEDEPNVDPIPLADKVWP